MPAPTPPLLLVLTVNSEDSRAFAPVLLPEGDQLGQLVLRDLLRGAVQCNVPAGSPIVNPLVDSLGLLNCLPCYLGSLNNIYLRVESHSIYAAHCDPLGRDCTRLL